MSETQAFFLALTFVGAAGTDRLCSQSGFKYGAAYGAAASVLFFGGVAVFQAPSEKVLPFLAACAVGAGAYVTISTAARLLKL